MSGWLGFNVAYRILAYHAISRFSQDVEVYLHVIIWAPALQTQHVLLTSLVKAQVSSKHEHPPSLIRES